MKIARHLSIELGLSILGRIIQYPAKLITSNKLNGSAIQRKRRGQEQTRGCNDTRMKKRGRDVIESHLCRLALINGYLLFEHFSR